MNNKFMLNFTAIALMALFSITALAQDGKPKTIKGPKIDLGTRVDLPCAGESGGDVASTVRVTNNTAETIPASTMVYVQTNNGKAHEALSTAVARRGTAIIHAPKGNTPHTCQAWFFKK